MSNNNVPTILFADTAHQNPMCLFDTQYTDVLHSNFYAQLEPRFPRKKTNCPAEPPLPKKTTMSIAELKLRGIRSENYRRSGSSQQNCS